MNRDKIKIIEFGMDDDGPSAAESTGRGAMKIIEFDNDPGEGPRRVATAKDVGRIKIVEFDDEPQAKQRHHEPKQAGRRIGPVKIKQFDEDSETREPAGAGPKIKIMEFD